MPTCPTRPSWGELGLLAEEAAGALGIRAGAIMAEAGRGNCECLLAYHGWTPVGLALVLEGTAGMGERTLWLELMYVRPGAKGAAEALRSGAAEMGREQGLPVLFLRRRQPGCQPGPHTRGIRRVGAIYQLEGE